MAALSFPEGEPMLLQVRPFRIEVSIPALASWGAELEERPRRGCVLNVSQFGLFLSCSGILPNPGQRVRIVLLHDPHEIAVLGTVRWCTSERPEHAWKSHGFGVELEPSTAFGSLVGDVQVGAD